MRTEHFRWGNAGRVEGKHYFHKSSQFTFQFLYDLFKDCTQYHSLPSGLNWGNLGLSEPSRIFSG